METNTFCLLKIKLSFIKMEENLNINYSGSLLFKISNSKHNENKHKTHQFLDKQYLQLTKTRNFN